MPVRLLYAAALSAFEACAWKGEFRCANAEALPFPDNTFDHVHSFGVIHHSPSPEAIVEDVDRVLKPGGTICVMLYNRFSIRYLIETMFLRKIGRLLLYPRFMPGLPDANPKRAGPAKRPARSGSQRESRSQDRGMPG